MPFIFVKATEWRCGGIPLKKGFFMRIVSTVSIALALALAAGAFCVFKLLMGVRSMIVGPSQVRWMAIYFKYGDAAIVRGGSFASGSPQAPAQADG